ncbi:hypothetical protein K438DRAFT_1977549 [Mycena galopus ATCC 62051]|nr:hypothetical protein K438DRAFT_1977549 [Mycena galopus ATCC 62051]
MSGTLALSVAFTDHENIDVQHPAGSKSKNETRKGSWDAEKQVTLSAAMYAIEGGKTLAEALESVSDLVPLPFLTSFLNVGIKVLEACKVASQLRVEDLVGKTKADSSAFATQLNRVEDTVTMLSQPHNAPVSRKDMLPCVDAKSPDLPRRILFAQLRIKAKTRDSVDPLVAELDTSIKQRRLVLDNFETPWLNDLDPAAARDAFEKKYRDAAGGLELAGAEAELDSLLTTIGHIPLAITLRGPRRLLCSGNRKSIPDDSKFEDDLTALASEQTYIREIFMESPVHAPRPNAVDALVAFGLYQSWTKPTLLALDQYEEACPHFDKARDLFKSLTGVPTSTASLESFAKAAQTDLCHDESERYYVARGLLGFGRFLWVWRPDRLDEALETLSTAKAIFEERDLSMSVGKNTPKPSKIARHAPPIAERSGEAGIDLDPAAARDAFKKKYRDAAGGLELAGAEPELDSLFTAIGHIPLAITLMAAYGMAATRGPRRPLCSGSGETQGRA